MDKIKVMTEKTVRRRILDASKKLFIENGFYGTTTRQIAKSSKTSESGVFRYFDNKYDILMNVYDDCWREVIERIEINIPNLINDPREEISLRIKSLLNLYNEDPALMTFIIINTGNTDTLILKSSEKAYITPHNLAYIKKIESLCLQCVNEKRVSPLLTSRSLCEGLLGVSEGILLGWYLADKSDNKYPDKIGIKESMQLIKLMLYGKI